MTWLDFRPPAQLSQNMRWAAAGFAGGLVAAGALLWLGLLGGPSAMDALQSRLVETLPGTWTSAAIDTFGFRAKPLLLIALVLLFGGAGALIIAASAAAIRSLRHNHDLALGTLSDAPPEPGRRRSIGLVLAAGATAFTGSAVWRVLAAFGEQATSPEHGETSEITTNGRFYVVSQNLVDPNLDVSQWRLDVTGLVQRSLQLTYEELLGLPQTEAIVTLECISNAVGGNLISNARWSGVQLAAVLERAGLRDGAAWVAFRSTDDYEESVPLELALKPGTLLAHTMNGAPLPRKHGFPLRALVAGRYGMKSPKWLKSIEVRATQLASRWERTGWDGERGVATMARIDAWPQQPAWGEQALLAGIAFAGDRGISLVEVSVDDGRSWAPADVQPSPSQYAWSRWQFHWTPPAPKRYNLAVRAIDGNRVLQSSERQYPYPSGATGYHKLEVRAD